MAARTEDKRGGSMDAGDELKPPAGLSFGRRNAVAREHAAVHHGQVKGLFGISEPPSPASESERLRLDQAASSEATIETPPEARPATPTARPGSRRSMAPDFDSTPADFDLEAAGEPAPQPPVREPGVGSGMRHKRVEADVEAELAALPGAAAVELIAVEARASSQPPAPSAVEAPAPAPSPRFSPADLPPSDRELSEPSLRPRPTRWPLIVAVLVLALIAGGAFMLWILRATEPASKLRQRVHGSGSERDIATWSPQFEHSHAPIPAAANPRLNPSTTAPAPAPAAQVAAPGNGAPAVATGNISVPAALPSPAATSAPGALPAPRAPAATAIPAEPAAPGVPAIPTSRAAAAPEAAAPPSPIAPPTPGAPAAPAGTALPGATPPASQIEPSELPDERPRALASLLRSARSKLVGEDAHGAELAARKALTIDPQNQPAMELLARALIDQDRGAAALPLARKLVRRAPQDAAYHVLLGDVLSTAGDQASAKSEWQRALQLSPDNPEIVQRLRR